MYLYYKLYKVISIYYHFSDPDVVSSQGDHLFESDMLLTEEQYQQMFDPSSMEKRGAIKQDLWPYGIIPFEIASGVFSQEEKEQIQSAMK